MPRNRPSAPPKVGIRREPPSHDGDVPQIERLFEGFEASRSLFEIVSDYIQSLGGVTLVPRKTQVGFSHTRLFAWVWLPQVWIKQAPQSGIVLTIGLDHPITDPRVKQSVEPYPGRHVHHIQLTTIGAFDARIRAWLREAHALAGTPRQPRSVPTKR